MLYERWRDSWLQYSKQTVQEILFRSQESCVVRSDQLKNVDSEAMLQAKEVNTEYQITLASHSPVWFITFVTLAKASRDVELCLMYYQNIAKLLSHPSSFCSCSEDICHCFSLPQDDPSYIHDPNSKHI